MRAPEPREPRVEVVVQLSGAAADEDDLRRAIGERAEVVLEALHPGTSDPALAHFAVTRVARSAVQSVLGRIRECPGVDAAYTKPDDALPHE